MSGFTRRMPYGDLPPSVQALVESSLGAAVTNARDVQGGMSPGPAAVLCLADGRDVFAKLNNREVNARSHELYTDEIAAYRSLQHLTELPMPRLVATVQTGPWVGLLLTVAPGSTPGPPWRADAIAPAAAALAMLGGLRAPRGLPPAVERLPDLDGWAVLAQDPPQPLDHWDQRIAPVAASYVEGWRDWTAGDALVHHDCRCDNTLVDGAGRVTLVDWNFACAGASWLDVALLACDVVGSGIEAATLEECVERAVEMLEPLPGNASRFAVAMAGMMRRNSLLPAHAGLPTFRAWQAARADRLRPLVAALLPSV